MVLFASENHLCVVLGNRHFERLSSRHRFVLVTGRPFERQFWVYYVAVLPIAFLFCLCFGRSRPVLVPRRLLLLSPAEFGHPPSDSLFGEYRSAVSGAKGWLRRTGIRGGIAPIDVVLRGTHGSSTRQALKPTSGWPSGGTLSLNPGTFVICRSEGPLM